MNSCVIMKNIAVILAGGSGSRLGGDLPKQFLKVAGKKIIEHTIDVFEHNKLIDEIAIVSKEEYISDVEQLVISNHYKKVAKILCGGVERYHSSLSAINAYTNDEDNLLFHDAVRPLVNDRIINDCIAALSQFNAVDVAIRTTDTIIQLNENGCIDRIPSRDVLRNGQTPQCFKRGTIKRAYDIALNDPSFSTTDDCGVVRRYLPDEPVYVVSGEVFNMKITYAEDIFLLDKLFQLKSLVGSKEISSNTVSLKNAVLVVFGGSYGIGGEIVSMSQGLGAKVYAFSRSLNNVDVTDEAKVAEVLAMVYAKEGKIDYVVCTAGILVKQSLESMNYDKIHQSLNVNLGGVINVAKEAHKYLAESKGSLLFYTSSSYTRGRMMYSIYSATKAAIVNFVQALSEEWFEEGIRINCINPERTRTPMRVSNFGVEPEGSLLEPIYVAIASLNTLTDNVTGQVIDVRR